MNTEFELGFGIEEYIQIGITTNFSMENYYGETIPGFYKAVMDCYVVLEEELASFVTNPDEPFTALKEAAMKYQYNENIQQCKQMMIDDYLAKCQEIVGPLMPEFKCNEWYTSQNCADVVQERMAIINLMREIRKLEEEYMERVDVLKAKQDSQDLKQLTYERLRHRQSPRTSDLGGYMPYKRDMKNSSYFLNPEQLRSIFNSSDKGDA